MRPHIILTYNKLILLDLLLPLLMELNKRYDVKITVIVYNSSTYEYLIRNYHIMEALRRINANIMVARSGNRLTDLLRLGKFILGCTDRTNVILKAADTLPRHKLIVSILKKVSTIIECIALNQITEPAAVRGEKAYEIINPNLAVTKPRTCDVYLSSELNGDVDKTIYMGYMKRLPEWSKFVNESFESFKNTVSKDYYLFLLSSTEGKRLNWLNEPDRFDLLCETLMVLKQFSSKVHAVLRPHPVSNMESLYKAMFKVGFGNSSISYAHPSVISKGAKFVISNCFSIASIDASIKGVTTIDYFRYDKRLEELCKGWSPGGDYVSFYIKDSNELSEIVSDILRCGCSYNDLSQQPTTDWTYWDRTLKGGNHDS